MLKEGECHLGEVVGENGLHSCLEAEALLDWMWGEWTSTLLVCCQDVLNFNSHTLKREVDWLILEKPQELRAGPSLSLILKVKLAVSEVSFWVEQAGPENFPLALWGPSHLSFLKAYYRV